MRTYDECKAYVDYLVAEHRRLHRLLLHARKTIAGSADAGERDWTQKVIKVLRDLRGTLQCHFADEEEGGCLDEAVSFQPALSADVNRIEAEHPRLLAEVDRLIAQAEDGGTTPADHLALTTAFDELCRELHTHEAAENEVLRRGFGVNLEANGSGLPSGARAD
jgi:hemerythrin